jgi:hypothetical protein
VAGRSDRRGAGGPGAGAAAWLLLLPLRLLASGVARRLGAVVVLTVLLVAVMSVLYDHAERPTASALPATVGSVTAHTGPAREVGQAPQRPQAAAEGWYARRLGVPRDRVKALGSQPLGPGRLRVLVLADLGKRQPTAWVSLVRTHGGWTVTG